MTPPPGSPTASFWVQWLILVLTALLIGPAAWVGAFLGLAPLAGVEVLADPLDAVVVLVVAYVVGVVPALVMALLYGLAALLVRARIPRLLIASVIGGAGTGLLTLFAIAVARESAGESWLFLFPAAGAISALLCALIADLVFARFLARHD